MEQVTGDTLRRWHEEGRLLVQQHHQRFQALSARAQALARKGERELAAVHAAMAAYHATHEHCGLFVSPELEGLLTRIGRSAVGDAGVRRRPLAPGRAPERILHVATTVTPVGGLTRLLWRWIREDRERSHSVALTRHLGGVPQPLREAVAAAGGHVFRIDEGAEGPTARARRLREAAATADLVVLHTCNHDIIPLLAFAEPAQRPPTAFVDHNDHMFWLGVATSDVVVSLRESGLRLARRRRGVGAARSVLLPTLVDPARRTLSRAEAKQRLSLPQDAVVLLSVARGIKYESVEGVSYADAHAPLLERCPNAVLVVVGPGPRGDWAAAIRRTGGRIVALGEQRDPGVFFQAADIYVDSFPFVSNTSLLEAGSFGAPVVSRFPFSDESEVVGADMPGLTGNLLRARTQAEYERILAGLVEDGARRARLGEATAERVAATHTGSAWRRGLEALYAQACSVPRRDAPPALEERMALGEPDVLLPRLLGRPLERDEALKTHLGLMPAPLRVQSWLPLAVQGRLQGRRLGPAAYLLPEWVISRVGELCETRLGDRLAWKGQRRSDP